MKFSDKLKRAIRHKQETYYYYATDKPKKCPHIENCHSHSAPDIGSVFCISECSNMIKNNTDNKRPYIKCFGEAMIFDGDRLLSKETK